MNKNKVYFTINPINIYFMSVLFCGLLAGSCTLYYSLNNVEEKSEATKIEATKDNHKLDKVTNIKFI